MLRVAAVVLGAALAATAQQPDGPARRPVFGRVVDGDGRDVGGAEVLLVGLQTGMTAFEADDVVAAVADARGRFRAQVLPGLPYFAFAVRDEEGGGAFAAPAAGWFGAGATLELVGEAVQSWEVARFEGLERWKGTAELRAFARPGIRDRAVLLPHAVAWPEVLEGKARWPRLPFGVLELRNEADLVVWSKPVAETREPTISLPPPREVRCSVADPQGAPIAGAEIWVRGTTWNDGTVDGIPTQRFSCLSLLGRTGADGVVVAYLPGDVQKKPWPQCLLVARASGRAEAVSGTRNNERIENDRRVDAADVAADAPVKFVLAPRELVRGELRGKPAANPPTDVVLRATCKLAFDANSYMHDPRTNLAPVDEAGRFVVDHVPSDLHASQWVVRRGRTCPPLLFAAQKKLANDSVVDLTESSTVSVSVLAVDAGPAAGRAIYLRRLGEPNGLDFDLRVRTVVDSAGRAVFEVAPGKWAVQCFDDTGTAGAEIDATGAGAHAVRLELKPHAVSRGVVVDGEGRPLEGVRFEVRAISGNGQDRTLSNWSLRAARRITSRARSGADGSFEVLLPMFTGQRLVFCATAAGRRSADFEPDESGPLRIELR